MQNTTGRFLDTLKTAIFLVFITCYSGIAKETPVKSPEQLSDQLIASYKKVKSSSVAISCHGAASGVIISKDGLVLTAAHVIQRIADDVKITITLENGKSYSAKKLGYNVESDLGLFQIENPNKDTLPVCPLAKSASGLGEFVFTYSHPSGALKGRPAQLRIGRVLSVKTFEDKPFYLFSDLNIQPGDSGGPLFNLNGELVGINSSAAGHIGFNIFGTIDQYYRDLKKLINKEILGDPKNGPMNGSYLKATFNNQIITDIKKEIFRRLELKHYKTIDFIKRHTNDKGEAILNGNDLVNLSAVDSISMANGQKTSMGLDDPALIDLLPKNKVTHFFTWTIEGLKKQNDKEKKAKKDQTTSSLKAIALGENLLLVKASLFNQLDSPYLVTKKKKINISNKNVVKRSKELDLMLLKIDGFKTKETLQFSKQVAAVAAGNILMAPDYLSRPIWNIATDKSRIVAKKRSIGPMKDKLMISKHRSPYPLAIRHALPLFAADAGTPVFDLKGDFVGIHIARFSRTMGLILPQELVHEFYQEYLDSL